MNILSPELRQAILDSGDQPVNLLDPQTQEHYVLLPQPEACRAIAASFGTQSAVQGGAACLLGLAGKRANWDDPEMDVNVEHANFGGR